MKTHNKQKPILISLIMLGTLLIFVLNYAELSLIDIKIGYAGQKTNNEMTYSYTLFNGKEPISLYLEEDQALNLTVDANIQKGKLNLILKDPQNNVIFKTELENGALSTDMTINQTGYYRLILEGSWASGAYLVSWDVS